MKRTFVLGGMLGVTVLAMAVLVLVPALAAAQDQSAIERGQQVFAAQKCSICHSIDGQGNKKGPLDGVGARLSAGDIEQWIVNAPAMAAKAKAERRPAMRAFTLPKDELAALVAYVQSLKK